MHNFFECSSHKTLCKVRDCLIVIVAIAVMVYLLVKEYLRPGLVLFSVVVVLLGTGVISVSDALAGFSNRGMITVALLFLVSEGIRASECLKPIMRGLFPSRSDSISRSYAAILPAVAAISAPHKGVVPTGRGICKEVPHSTLIRRYFGRYVHADRHLDKSCCTRTDD